MKQNETKLKKKKRKQIAKFNMKLILNICVTSVYTGKLLKVL